MTEQTRRTLWRVGLILLLLLAAVLLWRSRPPEAEGPAVDPIPAAPPPPAQGAGGAAGAGGGAVGLSEYHQRRFRERGLENPERDIVRDLIGRPELIPHEGVLGGTMFFVQGETAVLTDRWVLATYEDGHIRGRALFEYEVGEEGAITWELIQAYID